MKAWTDISERYSFEDEHLVYVDAPLEGFLRSLETGELFAFRSRELVPALLWHWILIPVPTIDRKSAAIFESARANTPPRWLSIVEDRRLESPILREAWINASSHPVPTTW